MAGKKRAKQDEAAIAAELDAQHAQMAAEVEADYAATEHALGFTRRGYVYVLARAFDMTVEDMAAGFKGDRAECLTLLTRHMLDGLEGLANEPVPDGMVLDSPEFDADDPEKTDV